MLKITHGKGFHMEFENGFSISVQFGYGNYCSNKLIEDGTEKIKECANAEIMIWNKNDRPRGEGMKDAQNHLKKFCKGISKYAGQSDSVEGWLTADQIGKIIGRIANYKECE